MWIQNPLNTSRAELRMNRRQKREIVKEEKCCREVCPWTPRGLCGALVAVAPVDESR